MKESDEFEQIPFGTDDFAENPDPRCACLLLLDTSTSMEGRAIQELNAGLRAFKQALMSDDLASKRVEIGILTFGPVRQISDFTTAQNFEPPTLRAEGDTPLGEAICAAIEMVKQRKRVYRDNGVPSYRPWIFLITDGEPSDECAHAGRLIREGESQNSFSFFPVAVEGADTSVLKEIANKDVLNLQNLNFRELFKWLSDSLKMVSRSRAGERVALPAPKGWSEV